MYQVGIYYDSGLLLQWWLVNLNLNRRSWVPLPPIRSLCVMNKIICSVSIMCMYLEIYKYIFQLSGRRRFCLVWDQVAVCVLPQDVILLLFLYTLYILRFLKILVKYKSSQCYILLFFFFQVFIYFSIYIFIDLLQVINNGCFLRR